MERSFWILMEDFHVEKYLLEILHDELILLSSRKKFEIVKNTEFIAYTNYIF